MAMEVESLTASKDASPKALKGSAKEDLLELSRQYKLKAKQAENTAKGLMKDTFGAPTLEQPTLLRGPLTRKRFQKGGEVKKAEGETLQSPEEQPVVEESSASRALKQLVAPVREGIKGYFGMEPETSGSEAYRTGQALSNMPGVGAPAALGIFIGRGAKGWNKAMNDVAKKMSKQGATPEEVWQTTGNFKGPDGMWRQEISDQAARINPSVSQGPLSMYLKHPELYENYPDLRQVLVRTDPDVRTSSYSPAGDDILIKSRDPEKGVSSALHEVSHAIQTREGFAPGGSSLMAFKDPQAFDVLKEVRASMSTPTSKEVYRIDAGWSPEDVGTKAFEDAYKQYVKYIKDQSKTPEFDRLVQERAANVYYERLLGEAEARAVESRRLWTPEQRLQGIPSQSYERIGEPGGVIPLEKLIIKKSEGGEVLSSPEEQPVTEESSASKMLKQLIEPVREGAKGYFGTEPADVLNPTEAYRTGQAMANMPAVGAVAGAVGLGSRAIPAAKRLLLMPCSDMKCATPAEAKDLYKGVFYQTYRNQVQPGHEPQMMILSAKHGFVTPKQMLEPYNQKMTPQQADELVKTVKQSMESVQWPAGIEEVMLVGGKHYQKVMNAAVEELKAQGRLPENVVVRSTKGEIGQQRQQLGQYLRGIAEEGGEPLSKSRGGFIANSLKPGAYAQGGPVDTSTARAQLAKLKAA
jgi:hypothetical protein